MNLTAAILAGGKSRRMGADKAALQWGGVGLLTRVAATCIDSGLPTIVVGRPMPANWPIPSVDFFTDDTPNQGPLGGLLAALRACAADGILTLPCDMPLLDRGAIEWLILQARGFTDVRDGVVVTTGGKLQPLFAIYMRRILPKGDEQMALGRRSLVELIETGDFHHIEAPPTIAERLINVNTPDDLAAAAKTAQRLSLIDL